MYHHSLVCLGMFVVLFAGVEFMVAGAFWLLLTVYYSLRPIE